jgi:GT2 family glycosyltransferase
VTRPSVSVVMPFAGDRAAARAAIEILLELDTQPGDELILADNSGVAPALPGVKLVRASGEQSPANARNAGAAAARGDWILFLDADCVPTAGLLAAYFASEIGCQVGALAGDVVPLSGSTFAERYGASRSFLSQEAHLAHPFRPRAVAANLLVRRDAFEQVGGFYEGVRAAEDTDFSWRLQEVGWRLERRPEALVQHRYRATLRELRRQWRGYAAGRAWLARRYEGFEPEPAVRRIRTRVRRALRVPGAFDGNGGTPAGRDRVPGDGSGRFERGRYFALDAVLAVDELAGLTLSNKPARDRQEATDPVRVVLVAEHFPARDDPLADFARSLEQARVEASARPEVVDGAAGGGLRVDYREDDGIAARASALVQLTVLHPARCLFDVIRRRPGEPKLSALAPSALRLAHDRDSRVQALGGDAVHQTARRLAALAGRRLESDG